VLATLGKVRDDTTGELVWPHYRITDVVGLQGFDFADVSEPKTEAPGEVPYPTRPGAVNVTYSIEVRGRTLQEMRAGGQALRTAFGPDILTGIPPERVMIVTPHPDYGTQEHAFLARCLQCVPPSDAQAKPASASPTPFVRNWTIGLRRYDPRIYEWDPGDPIGLVNPKW
jgi:hypothetical protein